jgi:hypothetical protein
MKYKEHPLILYILCAGMSLSVSCSSGKKGQTSKTDTSVIFFDDFSGKELDRTKWNVRITGGTVNNEQQAYVDSSLTISIVHGAESEGAENGALVLRPHFSPGLRPKKGRSSISFPVELIHAIKYNSCMVRHLPGSN